MDTLRGNRQHLATMTTATVRRELALAPAPHASDMFPIDMVANHVAPERLDGGMAPLRATSHVSGQRPL